MIVLADVLLGPSYMKRSNHLEGPRIYENAEITQNRLSYLLHNSSYISPLDPTTALVCLSDLSVDTKLCVENQFVHVFLFASH
jgi:hypothetical protein